MISLGSEAQLIVGYQVYGPSHVKVWQVGQAQRLHHYPLRGECGVPVHLETQGLRERGREGEKMDLFSAMMAWGEK